MILTGVLLIALPIAFNVVFALLALRFDYPGVLRRPAGEVLERFAAGGTPLVRLWWAFMLTALALVPAAVLAAGHLPGADPDVLRLAAVSGVLAGLVQALGLLRWSFVVPHLARVHATSTDEAERVVQRSHFDMLNRYFGVGVGEHLGYGLTGAWTALTAVAVLQADEQPALLGWLGLPIALALLLSAREFVGAHEPEGWAPAEAIVPVAYVAWSLWLLALGVALL